MSNIRRAINVTNLVASVEAAQVTRVRGNYRAASAIYVQLFDAKALPANGTVPLEVLHVTGIGAFNLALNLNVQEGLVVAFSSTAATLTVATGAGNVGDIVVEGRGLTLTARTTKVVSNANVAGLEIWAASTNPGGRVRLLTLVAKDDDGAPAATYVQLHNKELLDIVEEDVPLRSWKLPANTTIGLDFGDGLVSPAGALSVVASLVPNVYHDPETYTWQFTARIRN
jgi:hypothetical protein